MHHLVIDEIPHSSHLVHIPNLDMGRHNNTTIPPSVEEEPFSIYLGGGLPPVPGKLAKRIEEGQFIEMTELLPERLSFQGELNDPSKQVKFKHKMVTDILEWLQCFGIYMAIISRKEPHRVVDLLAYQHLIIQAHQEYQGDCWLGYDRRFCQRAATNSPRSWSTINPTLWSLAFSGKASCTRCSHCFSTSHLSKNCELNPGSSLINRPITLPALRSQVSSNQGRRPICFDWNENPAPGCPHPSCRFEHSCYYCTRNPAVREKGHKAIFCPHRVFSSQK